MLSSSFENEMELSTQIVGEMICWNNVMKVKQLVEIF